MTQMKEMEQINFMAQVNLICREKWEKVEVPINGSKGITVKVDTWAKERLTTAGYEVKEGDPVYFKAPPTTIFYSREVEPWNI